MKEEEGVATIYTPPPPSCLFLHHHHHGDLLLLLLLYWGEIRLPSQKNFPFENVLTGHMNSSDVAQPSKNNTIG